MERHSIAALSSALKVLAIKSGVDSDQLAHTLDPGEISAAVLCLSGLVYAAVSPNQNIVTGGIPISRVLQEFPARLN